LIEGGKMPTSVDFVGTVSRGLISDAELLKTFAAFLDYYWPEKGEELRWEFSEVFDSLKNPAYWTGDKWRPPKDISDVAGELVDVIYWDALDDLSPEGYFFGANPKDVNDLGYWR